MDSDQQDMCMEASRNAKALEEMLLTFDDVLHCVDDRDMAGRVVDKCEQIIRCMRECFGA